MPNSFTVALDRPMYQKIFLGLSVLMALGCVVWAIYKITYTSLNAMESFSLLAFNFTVLVAVPGLRAILVPSNLQFAPLFDLFIVVIWTMGLLALIVNVVRHDILAGTSQMPSTDGHSSQASFVALDGGNVKEDAARFPRKAAG